MLGLRIDDQRILRPAQTPGGSSKSNDCEKCDRRANQGTTAGARWLWRCRNRDRRRFDLVEHCAQRLLELARILKARRGVPLKQAGDHLAQGGRRVRTQPGIVRCVSQQRVNGIEPSGTATCVERALARQHLEEDDPEREEIAALIQRPAERLLRRHVAWRAGNTALCLGRLRRPRRKAPRDPKIQDLDATRGQQLNVRRLDVAVHDASGVRVPERVGNRHADPDRFGHPAGTLLKAIAKRHALDVLHDDHKGAAVVDDVVHLRDARVGQATRGASLAKDARARDRVGRDAAHDSLQRDDPLEAGIAGQVDLPHPAGAEQSNDLVGPDASAGGQE